MHRCLYSFVLVALLMCLSGCESQNQTRKTRHSELVLELSDFDDIFPILRERYAEHPIGTATIKNDGPGSANGVVVSAWLPDASDVRYRVADIPEIPAEGSATVQVTFLAPLQVLDVEVRTAAQLAVEVVWREGDRIRRASRSALVTIHSRNALMPGDLRAIAAFVNPHHEPIRALARSVAALAERDIAQDPSRNVVVAIALFEALRQVGMRVVGAPEDLGGGASVQFPFETLASLHGDARDLAVLYLALLESADIQTGFVPADGSIFLCFEAGIAGGSDQTVTMPDHPQRRWIPISMADIQEGFMKAWASGGKLAVDNEAAEGLEIYPLRETWPEFPPTALPAGWSLAQPQIDESALAEVSERARRAARSHLRAQGR